MSKRPKNRRWLKMGVELEGGWNTHYRTDLVTKCTDAKSKHDGSVTVRASDVGEVITRPHAILDNLCTEIEILHPEVADGSCGYHIHASFEPLDMSALASPEFYKYFKERWKAWGESNQGDMTADEKKRFWERYNGRTPGRDRDYCKDKFDPVAQLEFGEDRYTQLNYTAWRKYKTLEMRMLPQFTNKELTVRATREWSDILDTFLNEFDFPDIQVDREFVVTEEGTEETVKLEAPESEYWEEEKKRPMRPLLTGPDVHYHIEGAEGYMRPWRDFINEPHE